MPDPFAQYRRTPLPPEEAAAAAPAEYEAFAAKDKTDHVKIRRVGDPTTGVFYALLMNVIYDEIYGTEFMLIFSHMIVLASGRNLQAVGSAILSRSAEFIQEFDSSRWPMPKDAKAPVIESIKVFAAPGGPPLDKAEFKFGPAQKGKAH